MSGQNCDGLSLLISSYDKERSSDDSSNPSEDEEDNVPKELPSGKRSIVLNNNETLKSKRLKNNVEEIQKNDSSLPIPKGILEMFDDEDSTCASEAHDGRVRSFEHFPGNWALHIYVPFFGSPELDSIITSLAESLSSQLVPTMHKFSASELHLSLSRTVPIRHYWIDSIVDQLKTAFSTKHRFSCILENPGLYTNDEKTRSFLGLRVLTGDKQLQPLVTVVDKVFEEFALPKFYTNPSFHVSVAWCLGDSHMTVQDKDKLQDTFDVLVADKSASDTLVFEVSEVRCKIGNKLFSFPLCAR